MDSISGHSEKNQPKRKNKFEYKLSDKGGVYEKRLDDLPFDIQKEIRFFMDVFGFEEEPKILIKDLDLEVSDLNDLPIDFLGHFIREAIVEDRFEDADQMINVVKKRGFCVDISDNLLTLEHKSNK